MLQGGKMRQWERKLVAVAMAVLVAVDQVKWKGRKSIMFAWTQFASLSLSPPPVFVLMIRVGGCVSSAVIGTSDSRDGLYMQVSLSLSFFPAPVSFSHDQ